MKYSEIIRRVRQTAGDLNVLQFTDDALLDWMNDAVREIAIENNLLQKTATTSTVAGQTDYTLPTDIMKLHSILLDGEKQRIHTLQQFEEIAGGVPAGVAPMQGPYQCYIWANKITIYPAPDKVMVMKTNYIYEPVDGLIASISTTEPPVPKSYHLRIVTYCLAQVALQDEDTMKYQNFMAMFKTGIIDLAQQSEQEEDLYPFIAMSSRDMGEYPAVDY